MKQTHWYLGHSRKAVQVSFLLAESYECYNNNNKNIFILKGSMQLLQENVSVPGCRRVFYKETSQYYKHISCCYENTPVFFC